MCGWHSVRVLSVCADMSEWTGMFSLVACVAVRGSQRWRCAATAAAARADLPLTPSLA